MASWKKVIVSGSTANLAALQVDNLTSGSVVIGGGAVSNLTVRTINGNGNILATTGATGRIVSYDSTNRIIYYIKEQGVQNNIAFATTYNITGGTSTAVGTASALGNPEVKIDSGDIIYYENRRPINRASDQLEDIKIVVEM